MPMFKNTLDVYFFEYQLFVDMNDEFDIWEFVHF